MLEDEPIKVRYRIHAVVEAIYQGKVDSNWYVCFEGSHEALSFGPERPDFAIGDKVHITFMKEE